MKTTMKLLSILLLFMLTQSCTKDNNCGDTSDVINNYTISADDKAKIPFKGNDTLIYISDAGDTATLIGQGTSTWTEQIKTNISGGDCEKNQIDKKENISFEYIGLNSNLSYIKFHEFENLNGSNLNYSINNLIHYNAYPGYINNIKLYTDSVKINNIFYKGMSFNLNNSIDIIYNYNYGFLKLNFVGGKIWKLKI